MEDVMGRTDVVGNVNRNEIMKTLLYTFIILIPCMSHGQTEKKYSYSDFVGSWKTTFMGYAEGWSKDTNYMKYESSMSSCDSSTYFICQADGRVESVVVEGCYNKKWGENSKWMYDPDKNTMKFYTESSGYLFQVIMSKDKKRMFVISQMIGIESGVQTTMLTVYEKKKE
jgi:hypothetical protein